MIPDTDTASAEVCYHSGLPQATCPHSHDGICVCESTNKPCRYTFVATPSPEEIARRTAAVRAGWDTDGELARRIIHQQPVYVSRAVFATDHMRRRDGERGAW